ncbi:hypothetical protein VOLCADRAFT_31243, partial [Volvox carteri f. nagariensis]
VVLGIESSCDDTAAAVVRGDGTVLSHEIASQTGLHEQYGGVKPDVARQAHAAAIEATVNSALQRAGVEAGSLTAVAVTAGPGLALCLQVGVQYGLTLAARHGLPYIPVHHMEAHAMMTRLPSFPSLLLLVSGGHNMLVLCEGVGRHRIIGTTLDDSVGECFDKIARVAGITAVPVRIMHCDGDAGGPHLERMAASARLDAHIRYPLTLPLANGAQKDSCNFSFSGLKTQVMTLIMQKRKELGLPDLPPPPALAAAAAAAAAAGGGVTTACQLRRERQQQQHQPGFVRSLVVAGGVAANAAVRTGLSEVAAEFGLPCVYPPVRYCTDNGLMVAWTGVERLKLGL